MEAEAALRFRANGHQHCTEHGAVSVAGLDEHCGDVAEDSNEPFGNRRVRPVEQHLAQVEQPLFGEGVNHVLPGGEVVEERPVGDVGPFANGVDLGGIDAL